MLDAGNMSARLVRLGLSPVRGFERHLELSRAAGDEVGGLVLVTERVPPHDDRLHPPWQNRTKRVRCHLGSGRYSLFLFSSETCRSHHQQSHCIISIATAVMTESMHEI